MLRASIGFFVCMFVLPHSAFAQREASAREACRDVFPSLPGAPSIPRQDVDCEVVAALIVDRQTQPFFSVLRKAIPARELQSTRPSGASTSGTGGQNEAIAAPQPIALAAATLAAVGSDGGSDAIASIAVNPAMLLTDPADKEAVARLSRFLDLSLLVPVDGIDRDEDGDIDYFGLRVRINATGLSNGSRLLEQAQLALGRIAELDAQRVAIIEQQLVDATDVQACARELAGDGANEESLVAACGAPITLEISPTDYETLARALAVAREEADSRYLGLDLRFDVGDPTLGAVPLARGRFLTAGLAAGRNYAFGADALSRYGVNARLAVRYASLSDTALTSFAAEGGIGLEVRRPFETQQVAAGLGLEFRQGGEEGSENQTQTNFLMVRSSLRVPLSASAALSIGFGKPLTGDTSSQLSVAFDSGLLLPRR